MAEQITKEEFDGVLDHCEEVCAAKSCIETEHTINQAEIPMLCLHNKFAKSEKNNAFNIFGIYTEFDEHMKGVIITAFYTRMSQEYL